MGAIKSTSAPIRLTSKLIDKRPYAPYKYELPKKGPNVHMTKKDRMSMTNVHDRSETLHYFLKIFIFALSFSIKKRVDLYILSFDCIEFMPANREWEMRSKKGEDDFSPNHANFTIQRNGQNGLWTVECGWMESADLGNKN
jgi:hypothetical protein